MIATAALAGYAFANRVPVKDVQSIKGSRVTIPSADMAIVRATWSIDPAKRAVTDVDLLIFVNSPVWKLNLFEFFTQVSCQDESAPTPREFTCATGSTRAVLPSHWIGLRPIRIELTPPINPESIHDLGFIVTHLNRVPQTPPALFVGAMPAQIELAQGQSKVIDVVTQGVGGVLAGTKLELAIANLPQGVTASFDNAQAFVLEADPTLPMNTPRSTAKLRLTAAANAPMGGTDASVAVSGGGLSDTSLAEIEVVAPAFAPGAGGG